MDIKKKKIIILYVFSLVTTAIVSGILISTTNSEATSSFFGPNSGTLSMNGHSAHLTSSMEVNNLQSGYNYQLNYTFDLLDDTVYDISGMSGQVDQGYCFYAFIIGYVNNSVFMTFQSINHTIIDTNSPIIEKTIDINVPGELSVVKYGFQLSYYLMENGRISFISFSSLEYKFHADDADYYDYFDLFVADKHHYTIDVNLEIDEQEIEMEIAKSLLNSSSRGPYYFIDGKYAQVNGEEVPQEQSPLQNLELYYYHWYYNTESDLDSDDGIIETRGGMYVCNVSNFLDMDKSDFFFNTSSSQSWDQNGAIDTPERVSTSGFRFKIEYQSILARVEFKIGDPTYVDFLRETGELKQIAGFQVGLVLSISLISVAAIVLNKEENR